MKVSKQKNISDQMKLKWYKSGYIPFIIFSYIYFFDLVHAENRYLQDSSCLDTDTNFTVYDKEINCESLNLPGNGWKCNVTGVEDLCPTTCGKCPCNDVPNASFRLLGDTRTCSDLLLKRFEWACNKRDDISELCPRTCGKCPCAYALDSTREPFRTGKTFSTCSDLKIFPRLSWTCPIDKFQDLCRMTCNDCICEDSSEAFDADGNSITCARLKFKKYRALCDEQEYKDRCKVTCGVCVDLSETPTPKPSTPEPTHRPTLSPASVGPTRGGFSGSFSPTSMSPSTSPTMDPSTSPTMDPSTTPTTNPSTSPTMKPTCPNCYFNRCNYDPNIMCSAWYCPTNVQSGRCTYCTYTHKFNYPSLYAQNCILSPWNMYTCSSC